MDLDLNVYRTFKEGEAEILLHYRNESLHSEAQVNRDLSIAVLRTFISKVKLEAPRVLEALSTSNLRVLRYACEIDGIGQVVSLHDNKGAYHACKRDIKLNGSVACSKVDPILADAHVHMLSHPKKYNVVDINPYGSPSILLDSAIKSVAEGGMLMCTATDLAVLCGGHAELCYAKYGSFPSKGKYYHEMALRILLACIQSHANRHRRIIVPVLSIQMDSYVQVFVRIHTAGCHMKYSPHKLSYVYQCSGCDSFHLQPVGGSVCKHTSSVRYHPGFGPVVKQECNNCGKKFNMGGPIWSAPIHDQQWVSSILANINSMKDRYPSYNRICAVLTAVSEELANVPLFLSLHSLCATLKCTSPQAIVFRSAVINAGYRISGTHVDPLGMKSDAPMEVIWDIMRCWVKNHPVKAQPAYKSGSVILGKEPVVQANFARAAVASLSKAQAKKLAWYLRNLESHWGPKLKAGLQVTSKHFNLLDPGLVDEILNGTARNSQETEEEEEEGCSINSRWFTL